MRLEPRAKFFLGSAVPYPSNVTVGGGWVGCGSMRELPATNGDMGGSIGFGIASSWSGFTGVPNACGDVIG